MKEITRRLYTKPVMLGMAFLAGMALLVGLFVTTQSGAAMSGFPVPAGNDEFETAADGETYHDFGGSPIPADFFGDGSQPFAELVALEGVPLSAGSDVDTIIQRHQSVSAPGGSTALTMTGLSLKSSSPITVTYASGGSESWDVQVGLSVFKASTGSMTINSSTFDSTLKVWPRFTFQRIPDGLIKVLDTGGDSGLTAQSASSDMAVIGSDAEPAPTVQPAPCRFAKIDDSDFKVNSGEFASAAASSSCPPVTLTSTGSPWVPGCGGICFPVPITEEERWARHRPRPKGSKAAGSAE